MSATAAKIEAQLVSDFIVGRRWVAVKQRRYCHDHSIEAITALRGLRLDKALLNGMSRAIPGETLERRDLVAFGKRDGNHTRTRDQTINDDCAGATFTVSATELGTIEGKVIS